LCSLGAYLWVVFFCWKVICCGYYGNLFCAFKGASVGHNDLSDDSLWLHWDYPPLTLLGSSSLISCCWCHLKLELKCGLLWWLCTYLSSLMCVFWFFPFLYDFVFLFVFGCYGVYILNDCFMMIVSLPGYSLMYSQVTGYWLLWWFCAYVYSMMCVCGCFSWSFLRLLLLEVQDDVKSSLFVLWFWLALWCVLVFCSQIVVIVILSHWSDL
jgi:hypothetical protein